MNSILPLPNSCAIDGYSAGANGSVQEGPPDSYSDEPACLKLNRQKQAQVVASEHDQSAEFLQIFLQDCFEDL